MQHDPGMHIGAAAKQIATFEATLLAVLGFKVFAIMKFKRLMTAKQPGQKASLRDIVEAHKPARKG